MFLSGFTTKGSAGYNIENMQETSLMISSADEMQNLGEKLGRQLEGKSTIELVGDVGAGKTTLAKGIAKGMGIKDEVSSPSFTLSRSYQAPSGLWLHHYDFYRLEGIGLLTHQLQESLDDKDGVTLIEWAKSTAQLLPKDRVTIEIKAKGEQSRAVNINSDSKLSEALK